MNLQVSDTQQELGKPQGIVLDGKPLPLSPLSRFAFGFLLVGAFFVTAADAYLDGERIALITLGLSGVILLAMSAQRGPYVLEALVRSRFTVELYARGFTVRRGRAVQAIAYDALEALWLIERPLLKNGVYLGWLRTVKVHALGVKADFTVFAPEGQQDPGAELLGRLFAQAEEAVEERRKAGGTLLGDEWTLDAEGLRTGPGVPVVALSELREAAKYQGRVSVWRGTEERPFLSVPEDGPNAHLLLALARRHMRAQARTQEAKVSEADTSTLGRELFEKSREAGGCLVLLALPALAFGAMCLFSSDPAVRVPGPILLVIGVLCAAFGAQFVTNRIEVHERGLVRRTLFGTRTLLYTDIIGFNFGAIREYRNGTYSHTTRSMAFIPRNGKPIRFTTDEGPDIDTDLDFLRDNIARIVADHLYQQLLEGGKPVQWGRNVRLGQGALSIGATGRKPQRSLSYSASIRLSIQEGTCFFFEGDEPKPVLALACGEDNFYPGLLLFQRLCSEAASHIASAPAFQFSPFAAQWGRRN